MSTNTLATLSEQYQALKIQIELAETDLDQAKRSGYPLEVERLEKVVSELQDEKDAVNLAISIIAAKENSRVEAEEKESKWKTVVGQCRAAKTEMERLAKALERARRQYAEAQAAADRAEATLAQFEASKYGPTDYATDEQLAEEAELGRAVRADLEKARFHLRESNVARTNAQMVAIRAAGEFNKLAETEYRLRPASKNPKVDSNFVRVIG